MIHADVDHQVWLYHGNSLELLDAIFAKYGEAGRFDAIFADSAIFPPNGGITFHAGKMVRVDKGDWDKSHSECPFDAVSQPVMVSQSAGHKDAEPPVASGRKNGDRSN